MSRTLLVGVLNVTPDSFSDGGRHFDAAVAVEAGLQMAAAGADWIDVGGESTRPGATPVPVAEEIRRVVPVVAGLAAELPGGVRISIDTIKAATARAALDAGATIVNDVSGGLLDADMLPLVAARGVTVILGHMRATPATMMEHARYDDVVVEVAEELAARVLAARQAGVRDVWGDPGIGFAKENAHNLLLLHRMCELIERVGVPVMVGVSRKRFIGDLTGKPAAERGFGTAAAVTAAILAGAAAVRVHDVAAMRDVRAVADAIRGAA